MTLPEWQVESTDGLGQGGDLSISTSPLVSWENRLVE